jgi:Rrf2 family protein
VVNQKFSFAVHILAVLAYAGRIVDSATIAASVNTNPVVVRRLLLMLRKAGLVRTSSGKHGGALLATKPNQISLLDVYDAVQPRPVIAINKRRAFRGCPVSCNMKGIMAEIAEKSDRALRKNLGKTTLEQVLKKIR